AVVIVREDARGERRLVAYVVSRAGLTPSGAEVRAFLRDRLPEHMVPAGVVFLPALPLGVNGKVDRAALPASGAPAAGAAGPPAALQDELEHVIAAAWREVLGVAHVGPKDNFFDVGGHSLLMVRLRTRLSKALHRDIS